jgi:thiamine pyrophosphokinase
MGTIIHKDESQDTTDMEKCLNFLMKVLGTDFKSTNLSPHIVIVYGAFGGRID